VSPYIKTIAMSKILIVDDSVVLLEVMDNLLQRFGYTTKTLSSANNIFHVINEFHPDLLIIDIFLSSHDGREICKNLRENDQSKDLLILVFSASPKAMENYISFCADDFLEKPFDITKLLEKIKSLLGKQIKN
jgi:DNA-binding response OmpR family regulator